MTSGGHVMLRDQVNADGELSARKLEVGWKPKRNLQAGKQLVGMEDPNATAGSSIFFCPKSETGGIIRPMPKRIIAFANQKGGVGKTTTSVNLSAALAERKKQIIVMDLDPQAHLTTHFGINGDETRYSSYEVLTESVPLKRALVSVRENIKLLPSGLSLAGAEQELVSVVGRETILRDAIAAYPHRYDYIIIDCPPSLGLLTLNALGAAGELFIPIQPHFLSLKGLSQLLETVVLIQRRINSELKVSGLIFSMYDSRATLTKEIVNDIEQYFERQRADETPWRNIRIFKTPIRCNVKLAESPSYGKTIFEYENISHGAEDYRRLAEEVDTMYSAAAVVPPAVGGATADKQSLSMPSTGVTEKIEPEKRKATEKKPDSKPVAVGGPAETGNKD
jgi:chromosome partitioning protein